MNATLSAPSIAAPSIAATFTAEVEAEGVLFDMDGVLVCSTGGDERCWMRWAEHHRTPLDIRRTHGRRASDTLREHLPGANDDTIQDHLAQLDRFAAEEQSGIIAYPGVKELLRSLPPYRWTVVTSASEAMMRARLQAAELTTPSRVVAGDHVTKGKPDSEGYRRGAALLSRYPAECVVIEDAPAGVRAGKRAGCQVIAVLSSHPAEELQEADLLVQSINQIAVAIDEFATRLLPACDGTLETTGLLAVHVMRRPQGDPFSEQFLALQDIASVSLDDRRGEIERHAEMNPVVIATSGDSHRAEMFAIQLTAFERIGDGPQTASKIGIEGLRDRLR